MISGSGGEGEGVEYRSKPSVLLGAGIQSSIKCEQKQQAFKPKCSFAVQPYAPFYQLIGWATHVSDRCSMLRFNVPHILHTRLAKVVMVFWLFYFCPVSLNHCQIVEWKVDLHTVSMWYWNFICFARFVTTHA